MGELSDDELSYTLHQIHRVFLTTWLSLSCPDIMGYDMTHSSLPEALKCGCGHPAPPPPDISACILQEEGESSD